MNDVHGVEKMMFSTIKTLFIATNARAESQLRDTHAVALIDQKIREAEAGLRAAKGTLASLVQRLRSEQRQLDALNSRIADMTERARDALSKNREDLATEAANAIATMENEQTHRRETVDHLDAKVLRLRQSVETTHRRIVDLKQSAITARAVRREQDSQMRMAGSTHASSIEDAEGLIAEVLTKDDPFEQSEILKEINNDLSHDTLTDRMADAGMGAATRSTASDVLARLKSE
jgi:phage shock protein A